MSQLTGFITNTTNITYLVVGVVLAVLGVFLIGLSYGTAMNRPDPNYLDHHNGLMKWIIKNRMTFCICITAIVVLTAIALILFSFGIFISGDNPL